jgi:hypothetical protein
MRPIQWVASSEILTPHPLTPPLVRGEDTLAGWRGGGGSIVLKTPVTALYSTYVSTLWLHGKNIYLPYLIPTLSFLSLVSMSADGRVGDEQDQRRLVESGLLSIFFI